MRDAIVGALIVAYYQLEQAMEVVRALEREATREETEKAKHSDLIGKLKK